MSYEVEVKFRVAELAEYAERIQARGAKPMRTSSQHDCYFNHPQRDFAETDEALRIRIVDGSGYLTYKGPRVDRQTKTREEIELGLGTAEGGAVEMATLLSRLGFRPAGEVRKTRREFTLTETGQPITIALDHVEGLGTFVELEIVAEADEEMAAAKSRVLELARDLGFGPTETRSYLELLQAATDEDE